MLGQLPSPPGVLPAFPQPQPHSAHFSKGQPSNASFLKRMLKNAIPAQQGQAGALGDYPADLPHRVLVTKGGAGQEGGMGPLSYPVIEGPKSDTDTDLLRQIRDLLYRMPQSISLEWRTKFIMVPREAISFIAPSNSVTVAAGTAVAIVTQTIQERFTGFLTHVGVGVEPPADFANITWQIRVNGAVHPEFANRIFWNSTISNPLQFNFELTQARTVQLVAINTGGADIECQGILTGWTEYMSSYKEYGASPATGIA